MADFEAAINVQRNFWARVPADPGLPVPGLPPLDLVALAPDPVDPETLYAGTKQDGVFKSTDAGETWSPAGVWPAGVILQRGLVVDPGDPSILYAGTDLASVLKLDQED